MNENFYVGAYEYSIKFMNGTHHVIDVDDYEMEQKDFILFTGKYEDCVKYKEQMEIDYRISCL